MTRTYNTTGLLRGGQVKLRTCTCCGDAKKTSSFTHNPQLNTYTPTCRDCGVWLYLLRQVFGPVRDLEHNRAAQRQREREYAVLRRHASSTPLAVTLQTAWR